MHFIHLETGKEAGVCVCGGEEVEGRGGQTKTERRRASTGGNVNSLAGGPRERRSTSPAFSQDPLKI